jgi:hypothetical protein
MQATAELNLFSGLPNPTWTLSEEETQDVLSARSKLPLQPAGFHPIPDYDEPLGRPRAGYRGIRLTIGEGTAVRRFDVFSNLILDARLGRVRHDIQMRLEKQLYASVPREIVGEFLEGMTYKQVTLPGSESLIRGLGRVSSVECAKAPAYRGKASTFQTHADMNNCYNYATKVLNTVRTKQAIPGSPNLRRPVTKAKLTAALADDRLELLGHSLPDACPRAGTHYLAVLLRKNPTGAVRDFHCLRLDKSGVWSHKDGIGNVRNVDDNGQKIFDITQAALSWEPELVGFYQFFESRRSRIG